MHVKNNYRSLAFIGALLFAEGLIAQTTVFSPQTTPAIVNAPDAQAVELGVRFRPSSAGVITAIRFYKGSENTGVHSGTIWTTGGQVLGRVTFSNETASGWQQATFATPVAVAANTTYIASYHAPSGRYSKTEGFFTTAASTATVSMPAGTIAAPNGLYKYGASGFPTSSYLSTNYWIDVVFTGTPVSVPPTAVNDTYSVNQGQTLTVPAPGVLANDKGPSGATLTAVKVSNPASGTLTFNSNGSFTLQPSGTFSGTLSFTYRAKSGTTNSSTATVTVTVNPVTTSRSIWSSTAPSAVTAADSQAVELGVKFRASVSGVVTGVRFFKATGNSGTHIGNLWSSSGSLLARATFTSETASGWQQVTFSAPVTIAANTTYIASYFAPNGNYSKSERFFESAAITNGNLRALASGEDGPNGLYRYGSASAFPTDSYQASNYWVDVLFTSGSNPITPPPPVPADTTAPTVSLNSPLNGASVSGTVSLAATASDNVGVLGVQFRVNGVAHGPEDTAAPYVSSWNTSSLSNGTYTLTAVARDAAGNTKTSTAALVQVSNNAPAPQSKIVLPIAVFGAAGTTRSVDFDVPSTTLTGAKLWMQLHGFNYPDKIGVQINNSAWISLNSGSVTLDPLALAYGGIGGGFHTLKMTLDVPAGSLIAGRNTIRFRFNSVVNGALGFRVVRMNILSAGGAQLLPPEAFTQEDPNTWTGPLTSATDIAEGKRLFQTGQLLDSIENPTPIKARCNDCHTQDGRDLKYFNYSNDAIRASAVKHGLSANQGDQIATYIRSLAVPNPGRPWNPVYQPGPGLDFKPVSDWAAGAGIDAVLDNDHETLNNITPGEYAHTANLNARETPIALQLPDWNHWLPKIHPKDMFGDAVLSSEFYNSYGKIRSNLRWRDVNSFRNTLGDISYWDVRRNEFVGSPSSWNERSRLGYYGASQWKMVKLWEVMQEFELEEFGQEIFGTQAERRSWWDHDAFLTSPNMLQIPAGPGIGNGGGDTHVYHSFIWYQLQLILNNSNKMTNDNNPIDWPYVYGFIKGLGGYSSQSGLHTLWQIKSMQISHNGFGPDVSSGNHGWQWRVNDISRLVHGDFYDAWASTPQATRAMICERLLATWVTKVKTFTPQQFYSTGEVSPGENLRSNFEGTFGERLWYAIPRFKHYGVSQSVINEAADWAKTVWVSGNWASLKTATCTGTRHLQCSTD